MVLEQKIEIILYVSLYQHEVTGRQKTLRRLHMPTAFTLNTKDKRGSKYLVCRSIRDSSNMIISSKSCQNSENARYGYSQFYAISNYGIFTTISSDLSVAIISVQSSCSLLPAPEFEGHNMSISPIIAYPNFTFKNQCLRK